MWALSPETEGVSCGLGDSVADRLCRDPQLRSLKPADLARMLGTTEQKAQVGILRLAAMATGRPATGVRGMSFDQAIASRGRTTGRRSVEYAPDARGFEDSDDAAGGFATPSAPGLLEPGSTDPRVRSFTQAILDPNLVQKFGAEAVKQAGLSGLVPPPEDLDRVALFAPPPISGEWPGYTWLDTTKDGPRPDGSYREPTWADVQNAGSAIGRPDLNDLAVRSALGWWRAAYAMGPLPEDEQGVDDPRSDSYNWPDHGTNVFRRIYFWGFGKDGKLYQHMQLQKQDSFENFRIFNKWGQNLTFVWRDGKWIAGWDAGDWFTQNKRTIVAGLQLAVTAVIACLPFAGAAVAGVASALFGISQFGFSLGVSTAIAGAVAAQQAFIIGMSAIAKGDLGAAFKAFSDMAVQLGNVPITGDAKLIPPAFQEFVKNPAIQSLAKVVGAAGTGDPGVLMMKAAELGQVIVKVGQAEIYEARKLIPDHLRPWFDRAVREGGQALQRKVPWYAEGTHTLGMVIGTLSNPQTAGVHAPRGGLDVSIDDTNFTLAQLEKELADEKATYARVAITSYGLSHPSLLALIQQKIDEFNVRIAIKKQPFTAVDSRRISTGSQSLAQAAFAARSAPTAPKTTSGGAVAAPIAGGILALLFFL
jgi:hypothetical protein